MRRVIRFGHHKIIAVVGALVLMLVLASSHAFAQGLGVGTQVNGMQPQELSSSYTATGTTCRFESNETYYATVTSPPEKMKFAWDSETGAPQSLSWIHGSVPWFLYTAPGQITREPVDFYY